MPVTKDLILEALKDVYDPEIPVNIVDLGLVYEVRVKPAMQVASELAPPPSGPMEDVELDLTLTSPGCPSGMTIEHTIKQKVEAMPGVQFATVRFIWEPQWTPERISAEGRAKLGIEV